MSGKSFTESASMRILCTALFRISSIHFHVCNTFGDLDQFRGS